MLTCQAHELQVKVDGFSEQDQENLYMATHLGKTSGKKGLGKGTQPKDIGGVKWAGKKTLLEDEDTQVADDSSEVVETAALDLSKTNPSASARQTTAAEPQSDMPAVMSGIKWKKRAKQLLSDAPAGKMKTKKLQKQLLQQCQCPDAMCDSIGKQLLTQLGSSKHFRLTQDSIVLVH